MIIIEHTPCSTQIILVPPWLVGNQEANDLRLTSRRSVTAGAFNFKAELSFRSFPSFFLSSISITSSLPLDKLLLIRLPAFQGLGNGAVVGMHAIDKR